MPGSVFAFDLDYLKQLQQQALQQKLHNDPYWHKLLHYEADLIGSGYTSLVDSPDFFNATHGKVDPGAELLATLESFFSRETVNREDIQQPRQCAFIARFHWLGEKLQFDTQRLPRLPCPDYEEWIATISPAKVTLIFPSAYLNNPSSMFGHTLLRIDKEGQKETSQLVSYSINYAASTDESSGLIFAYKGVIGQYPGFFSVLPYYEKVNEYNDLENRDIWEYTLNLNRTEIHRMLRHTWEMAGIYFEYYFIDENCSYQLLGLLQLARPDFQFTPQFPLWATPVDTLRAVLEDHDLLASAEYRPSAQTRIEHQSGFLTTRETGLVLDLVYGRRKPDDSVISSYPSDRQVLMFELAFDYLQYLHNEQLMARDPVARRSLDLLKIRSGIDAMSPVGDVPEPEYRPDQGHETSRLALRRGQLDHADYTELSLRPAYHDLLDDHAGFVKGSQINFFNLDLRYFDDSHDLKLQRVDFFDAFSLSPRSAFFDPYSWKLKSSFERLYSPELISDNLVFTFEGGIGPAWRFGSDITFFALLDSAVWIDSEIEDDFAVGIGGNLGLHWPITDWWTIALSARTIYFNNNLHVTIADHELSSNFSLSRNTALRLSLREQGEVGESLEEASIGFNWYF
ncbi:MAG: DUF4105 domain-containing protein [Gammaproteobacteria bacterium]|nr:DUF4105 domain-containing protein [Gammaproteobacteria bacterium]